MKTILVDDEPWSMKQFETECSDISAIELVGIFDDSISAYEYAKKNKVDFALLDIEMPEMSGIELAEKLKGLYSEIIIVFVTAHKEYFMEFLRLRADYYVMKPYNKLDVENVIKRARLLSQRLKKRIFMHTFGRFDVFIDNVALNIKSERAKELLALMVNKRGVTLCAEEAFETIWENKEYNNSSASIYRKTLAMLHRILSDAKIEDILLVMPHGRALDTTMFDCDLYDFLDGDKEAVNKFNGEYMSQYSWGEPFVPDLMRLKYNIINKKE